MIYVVISFGGQYEDHFEYNVAASRSKDRAEARCVELRQRLEDRNKWANLVSIERVSWNKANPRPSTPPISGNPLLAEREEYAKLLRDQINRWIEHQSAFIDTLGIPADRIAEFKEYPTQLNEEYRVDEVEEIGEG